MSKIKDYLIEQEEVQTQEEIRYLEEQYEIHNE
jgi:hypothetical protein